MTRPEGLNADLHRPDAVREPEPTRPLRKFQPETQALIRHLIQIGDLTGFTRNGEPCVRLAEMVHYTAGGADPLREELDTSPLANSAINSQHDPMRHFSLRSVLGGKWELA